MLRTVAECVLWLSKMGLSWMWGCPSCGAWETVGKMVVTWTWSGVSSSKWEEELQWLSPLLPSSLALCGAGEGRVLLSTPTTGGDEPSVIAVHGICSE